MSSVAAENGHDEARTATEFQPVNIQVTSPPDEARLAEDAHDANRKLHAARHYVYGHTYVLNTRHSSLLFLRGRSSLRLNLFHVVDSLWFSRAIAAMILLNICITIVDTPGWRTSDGVSTTLLVIDILFQIVFTLELIAKIIALGLVAHRHSFLRSTQNVVDTVVVLVGFIVFGTSSPVVVRLMRLTRCLRALALMSRFALLRAVFLALKQAMSPLRDVLLLMLFVVVGMAVLGLQLFVGTFHQRCYLNTPTYDANGTTIPNRTTWQLDPLYANVPCSLNPNSGFSCPTPFSVCDRHDDVFHFDFRNFDYIWNSVYAVFKFVTLDNWPSDVQYIQHANGITYFLFGFVIVLFGSYFTLNLVLAVLSGTFEEVTTAELEKQETEEKLRVELLQQQRGGNEVLAQEQDNPLAAAAAALAGMQVTEAAAKAALDTYYCMAPPPPPPPLDEQAMPPPPPTDEGHGVLWRLRRAVWMVVSHSGFHHASLVVTVINIIVLATDHYGIDGTWDDVNGWINFMCAVYFIAEAFVKIVAMGTYYFRDPFNDFDFALCLVSIAELAVSGPGEGSSASALRAFRLARVMRVVNSSPRVRQLLITVATAGSEASLLFVFLIMYIVMGALFAVIVWPDAIDSSQRPNFSSFLNSLLSTFIIISGENWNDTVAAVMHGFSSWAMLFYIPYYILATYIIINFVVVILINSFNTAAEAVLAEDDSKVELMDAAAWQVLRPPTASVAVNPLVVPDAADDTAVEDVTHPSGLDDIFEEEECPRSPLMRPMSRDEKPVASSDQQGARSESPTRAMEQRSRTHGLDSNVSSLRASDDVQNVISARRKSAEDIFRSDLSTAVAQSRAERKKREQEERENPDQGALALTLRRFQRWSIVQLLADFFGIPVDPEAAFARMEGRSLMIFSADNPVRRFCVLFVSHPVFELVAMLVVLFGCISLGFENKSTRQETNSALFFTVNAYVAVFFFGFEMILRCVGFGVVIGEHAYLRDKWNVVDTLILILSILALFLPVRPAQAVRVFRLATRWKALRVILGSLMAAIPGIANIIVLVTFFFFVAGIVCVQVFKGRFAYCTDSTITSSANCTGFYNTTSTTYDYINSTFVAREVTSASQRYWLFAFFNFNHLGEAFLSMVFVMFSDGWTQLLYYVMDANSDTQAMSYDNSWYWAFLVCYLFLQNNYFLNNLFVGSLMDSFSAERAIATGKTDAEGHPLLTDAQERWIREYRFASATSLPRVVPKPLNRFREFLAWLYFSDDSRVDARPSFDVFITVCILINVVFMMTQFDGQPAYWTRFLYGVNVGFACVFALEFLIKIIAMTPVPYFSVGWNAFDFLLLISAFLSIFLDGPGTNAVRVFRVARLLRLVRRAKGLYRLFESLVYALPQLFNVTVLMILVLFVFGVTGVAMFENIYFDTQSNNTLNPFFNFHSVIRAMMLLFQISTTESWGSVLQACLINPENSPCTYADNNCGTYWAYPYFLIFMFMANSVCVNLFIFVVVDNFEEVSQIGGEDSQFLMFRLANFRRRWAKLDAERTGYLRWDGFVVIARQMHLEERFEYEQYCLQSGIVADSTEDADDEDDIASESDHEDDHQAPPAALDERPTTVTVRALAMFDHLAAALNLKSRDDVGGDGGGDGGAQSPFAIASSSNRDFVRGLQLMSIPIGDGGMVEYEDCLLGITKHFYKIDSEQTTRGGDPCLRSVVGYDREAVFKVHHAFATVQIQRALLHRRQRRRNKAAAESPPSKPEEQRAAAASAPDEMEFAVTDASPKAIKS